MENLYEVSVEMTENEMYYRTGMIIDEVVEADSDEDAIQKLLDMHSIRRVNISVIKSVKYTT